MIVKTPGTCGGVARIDGTRIAVWLIVSLKKSQTDEQILYSYPHITQKDIVDCMRYYRKNIKEITTEMREQ